MFIISVRACPPFTDVYLEQNPNITAATVDMCFPLAGKLQKSEM